MRITGVNLLVCLMLSSIVCADNGLVTVKIAYGVTVTAERLEKTPENIGMIILA